MKIFEQVPNKAMASLPWYRKDPHMTVQITTRAGDQVWEVGSGVGQVLLDPTWVWLDARNPEEVADALHTQLRAALPLFEDLAWHDTDNGPVWEDRTLVLYHDVQHLPHSDKLWMRWCLVRASGPLRRVRGLT